MTAHTTHAYLDINKILLQIRGAIGLSMATQRSGKDTQGQGLSTNHNQALSRSCVIGVFMQVMHYALLRSHLKFEIVCNGTVGVEADIDGRGDGQIVAVRGPCLEDLIVVLHYGRLLIHKLVPARPACALRLSPSRWVKDMPCLTSMMTFMTLKQF